MFSISVSYWESIRGIVENERLLKTLRKLSSYSDLSPQATTTAEKCQVPQYYQNRTVLPILIRPADKYSHGLDSFPPASYTGHS